MCGSVMADPQGASKEVQVASRDLQEFEDELAKQVPILLDHMNDAAAETNRLESELSRAQAIHKTALTDWSRLYNELRSQYGGGLSGAIDYAKPYFDALEKCQAATNHADSVRRRYRAARRQFKEVVVRLWDSGSPSPALAAGSQRVSKLRQEVKSLQSDYELAMLTLQSTKDDLKYQRSKVDEKTIEGARPCFKALHKVQLPLDAAHKHVAELSEKVALAKARYRDSMKELDRISQAIHKARSACSCQG